MIRHRLALFAFLCAGLKPLAAANCEGLSNLKVDGVTIATAQSVPAGAFTPPDNHAIADLPAFCRVAGQIRPSSDSDIQFELWMPSSGWIHKFQGIGNGGFAGSISFSGMGNAVAHGYATASTDTGHKGGATDAAWALGHPQRVIDFGYRAIHETAVKAKIIIRAFYGEDPRRSYFSSCSNGGRQALMEAQRYPADYDGIIAGAPANYWTHLLTGAAWDISATLGDSASYVPSRKLAAIEAVALTACDTLDGVKDGVIENPRPCHFDPSILLCKGPDSDSCLTAPQVTALKKIYSGPKNSHGKQLFPGYSPGGEAEPGGWAVWITGAAPEKALMFAFGTQFFKNMVFEDAAWDYHTFNVDRDPKIADDKMARVLNATDPDLRPFQQRHGKLILYHGWCDAAIPAQNIIDYYQSVISKMGSKDAAGFVRLFMVPGMQHCGGGAGPSNFGQLNVATGDAQHDMATALERWVEEGVAPEQVIATKYKNALKPAPGEVVSTRPLCAYPLVAHWKGSGSTDDAANFTCGKADAGAEPPGSLNGTIMILVWRARSLVA